MEFFFRYPAVGGEGEIKAVAVVPGFGGRNNRFDLRKRQPADAFQVIDYLLLLIEKLSFIVDVLPGAASARSKMNAERIGAMRGKLLNGSYPSFHVAAFDLVDFCFHCITGSATLQKNDHSIGLGNGFPFGSHGLYEQVI